MESSAYGSDEDFDQARLIGNRFFSFGDGHVLGFRGLDSTTNGEAPIQDHFRLGGILNLSGHVENALFGQQAAVVDLIYYKHFKALRIFSWYLGGSLEYGGVWEDKDEIFNDGIVSGSLFVGAETPIGPVYIGYGQLRRAINRSSSIWVGRSSANLHSKHNPGSCIC